MEENTHVRCPHCYKVYQSKNPNYLCCANGHSWKIVSTLDDQRLIGDLMEDYEMFLDETYPKLSWFQRQRFNKHKLFVKYLRETQKNLFDLKENFPALIEVAVCQYEVWNSTTF